VGISSTVLRRQGRVQRVSAATPRHSLEATLITSSIAQDWEADCVNV